MEQHDCSSLRYVFCGGGALTTELAREVTDRLPHAKLINVYGVTECCVDSTFHVFDPALDEHVSVPIGKAISNTAILLLDGKGRPVPRGTIGEIHIGGLGVGEGYLNRPEQSAASFIEHPYLPGTKLFKSGDLAWLNAKNEIQFVGRKGFQIKVNGFRIEPEEIEVALKKCGCEVAAVVQWQEQLVGYVKGATSPEEIRPKLGAILPNYMIPSMIIPVDQLPLNSSGKLDRRALPSPEAFLTSNVVNQASPRDTTELKLYNIWKTILLHPTIGIRDNFF